MNLEFTKEKYGFEVCRVCLKPETETTNLKSLFSRNGEKAEVFEIVIGFKIFGDQKTFPTLICQKCSENLEKFYEFRRRVNFYEREYFQSLRIEKVNKSKEGFKFQDQVKQDHLLIKSCKKENFEEKVEMSPEIKDETVTAEELSINSHNESLSSTNLLNQVQNKQASKIKISSIFTKVMISSQNSFKCKICNKILKTKIYLKKHFKNQHAEEKKLTCDICNKSVAHKQHMEYHMRQHLIKLQLKLSTRKEEKRTFQCRHCKRCFKTIYGLEQHRITHSNIRPFKCSCGRSFKTKGILKTHISNIH